VDSVRDEKLDVRDIVGCLCFLRLCRLLCCCRAITLETLVCSVVAVIREEASSSDSKNVVVSRSELTIEDS